MCNNRCASLHHAPKLCTTALLSQRLMPACLGAFPSTAVPLPSGAMSLRSIAPTLQQTEHGPAWQASFKREVSETVLRCAQQGFDPSFAVVELNGLKIAEDRTFADCASAILTTLLGLCFPAAPRTKPEYQELYPAAAADTGTPV